MFYFFGGKSKILWLHKNPGISVQDFTGWGTQLNTRLCVASKGWKVMVKPCHKGQKMSIYFLPSTRQTVWRWQQTSNACHSPSLCCVFSGHPSELSWGLVFVVGSSELFSQSQASAHLATQQEGGHWSGWGLWFPESRLLLNSCPAWVQGSGIALTGRKIFILFLGPARLALGPLAQDN